MLSLYAPKSLRRIRRLFLGRRQQVPAKEVVKAVVEDDGDLDDEDTLCELPSERFDGFVLFRVEDTVFKVRALLPVVELPLKPLQVHTSLLRLESSSSRRPAVSDPVAKPILRVPDLPADDFRLFLWDLNALCVLRRVPRQR
jgi:hypothetical protein